MSRSGGGNGKVGLDSRAPLDPVFTGERAIMSNQDKHIQKIQILGARYAASQFVYTLDVRTLLPVELAAPAIGKSTATFRSDLIRRPDALPPVVRRGGRVFVSVGDLIDWLNARPADPPPSKSKRGRPTKAEQLARMGGAS